MISIVQADYVLLILLSHNCTFRQCECINLNSISTDSSSSIPAGETKVSDIYSHSI